MAKTNPLCNEVSVSPLSVRTNVLHCDYLLVIDYGYCIYLVSEEDGVTNG